MEGLQGFVDIDDVNDLLLLVNENEEWKFIEFGKNLAIMESMWESIYVLQIFEYCSACR